MAVDLRQVMGGFLTFSMFIMLGNMIKRDHIDPLMEPLSTTANVQYDVLKVSKPGMVKLSKIESGPWNERDEPLKPCWKKLSTLRGKEQSNSYIFFSLSHGPEFHALQIANAVLVARTLGATLALPDIRGIKLGDKRHFGEIYDVDTFMKSLNGVVRVDKNPPTILSNGRLPIIKVPEKVSGNYIGSNIKPIFESKRNLKIVTYFNSSSKLKGTKENHQSSAYRCLATFGSLKLQPELQELVDSMVGMLWSLSSKMNGRFVAVDLKVEMLGKKGCQVDTGLDGKRCYNGEEIGEFMKKIGFHTDTTIYLTQTGWDSSLNALRNVFPNTFTKDAIMPADEKAKFAELESGGYGKLIDFYMCAQGDVFIPAFPSMFNGAVVGERIARGKTQVFVPAADKISADAKDYIPPDVAKKANFAHTCFC